MRIHSSPVFLAAIAAAWAFPAPAADKSDEQLIENAITAAPEAVGKNAAVVNREMKTLRKGTNGFTCTRTTLELPPTIRCVIYIRHLCDDLGEVGPLTGACIG